MKYIANCRWRKNDSNRNFDEIVINPTCNETSPIISFEARGDDKINDYNKNQEGKDVDAGAADENSFL